MTYLGQIHLWHTPWPITSYAPRNGEILPLERITIYIFTSITLSTSTIEPAFSIVPPVENMDLDISHSGGSTRIIVRGDFKIGHSYTYSLDTTAKTIYDEPLDYPLEVTFETEPFRLREAIFPGNDRNNIRFYFNAPILKETISSFFDISPTTEVVIVTSNYRNYNISDPLYTDAIIFDPRPIWRPGTTTSVTISGDLAAFGGATLGADSTYSFYFDSLMISSTNPSDLQTYVATSADLRIYCNTYIDQSTAHNAITISPDRGFSVIPSSSYLRVIPDSTWASLTTYTVKVDTSLRDYYGGLMNAPYEYSFTTK